ncbi:MAG: hypothetical protein WKF96_15920 [Solirubrobacteraceae bacterium]
MLTAAIHAAVSGGASDWPVIAALLAAALAFTGVMITLIVNGRRAERERLRELYAGGWAAVQAYKEMAFAVRRRNIDERAAERVRLSEAMREIQKDLSFHEALIGRERSGKIAAEYRILVAKTREIAGGIVKRSWNEDPIASDKEMHSPAIAAELAALEPFEDGYLSAIADRLVT